MPDHLGRAVEALVAGEVLAHAFGNFHVMTTRLDAEIVRSVNLMKGRRPDQVGSVLMTRANIRDLFDWSRLPTGVEPGRILDLIDDCFGRGSIGFRGPGASHMPDHLTFPDDGAHYTVDHARLPVRLQQCA